MRKSSREHCELWNKPPQRWRQTRSNSMLRRSVVHFMHRLSLIKECKDFGAFPRDSTELTALVCGANLSVCSNQGESPSLKKNACQRDTQQKEDLFHKFLFYNEISLTVLGTVWLTFNLVVVFSIITRPVKNQVNWTWGCCRVVGSLSELRRLKTNRKMSKRRRKVIKNEWHLLITTTFAWPAEKKLSHFLIFLIFAYSSLIGLLANTPGFDGHLVVGLKGFNCNISQFFVILYRFPSYNRSRWR